MFFARAHLSKWISAAFCFTIFFARSSYGCGVMGGETRIAEVNNRLEIRLDDGRLTRLAGLDAASPAAARERLLAEGSGRPLKVAVLAPRPDRWGRWLVDLSAVDGASLSDDLLAHGLVRVKPEFETRGCEATRLAVEARGRRESLGIWNEPEAALDATDLAGLAAAGLGLVVVEGIIRRVGSSRSRFYLDFAGRDGFTVVVARKAETTFQRRGIALTTLAGHQVRVRGYIDNRFGPRIELADPWMIERIDGVGGSQPGG